MDREQDHILTFFSSGIVYMNFCKKWTNTGKIYFNICY